MKLPDFEKQMDSLFDRWLQEGEDLPDEDPDTVRDVDEYGVRLKPLAGQDVER